MNGWVYFLASKCSQCRLFTIIFIIILWTHVIGNDSGSCEALPMRPVSATGRIHPPNDEATAVVPIQPTTRL